MEDIVAPLVGAWIEIKGIHCIDIFPFAAPLVGAWIEISSRPQARRCLQVALLKGAGLKFQREAIGHLALGRAA